MTMNSEDSATSADVLAEESTADVGDVAVPTPTGHNKKARVVGFAEAYTLPAVIVLLIVFFSVWPATSETFLTMANLNAVASSQGVIAILALAALIPLVTQRYDLSVGANMGLSSVVAATVMAHGYGLIPGLLAGLGTGVLVGLVNGFIIAYLKINDVVTTLGTTIIIIGIVSWITDGRPITENISPDLINFTSSIVWGIPVIVVVVALIAVAVHVTFEYTSPGRRLFMLGSNENAARLIGLRTNVLIMGSFAAAGLLAGFAGIMQLGRAGGALPSVGDSFTLPALAAAFLSQAAIKPGRVNVGGAITAVIFLAVLNAGLNLAGAPPFITNFVNGTALILGVGLAVYIGKIRDSFAKKV
jgi:ribose transport system permease protein